MNCREAEPLIFAERDGALDQTQRAALAQHVAQCAGCQRRQENLATGIAALRISAEQVRVPDAELEWQKLRREIRGGAGSKSAAPRRTPFTWLVAPLGAATVIAFAFFSNSPSSPLRQAANQPTQVVAAKSGGASVNPSTVVFVDDKSGYVFVWADDSKRF